MKATMTQEIRYFRVLRPAAVTLAVCLLVPGCQQSEQAAVDAEIELEFTPNPPAVGMAEVTMTMADASGQRLAGGELQLEGNMNHAGMKPVFATLQETEPGRYTGTLDFTMGGDWFVLVTGRLADGRRVNEKIDVPGVKRP